MALPAMDSPVALLAPPHVPSVKKTPGEKKVVTLLCCRLLPAEQVEADLDQLHGQMRLLYHLTQQVVGHYGGTLQPVVGMCVLAVFGRR